MKTLIGGAVAAVLGIIGLSVWWKPFLQLLAGAIPAVLLLGVPLLDLQTALAVPDRIRLGVDLTGFGLGALLALAAWKVSKRPAATVRAARRAPAVMAEVQS